MSSLYIVIRVFSKKERDDKKDRSIIYGWSEDKNTVKAFLQQRDSHKYYYRKFDKDDDADIIRKIFPEYDNDGLDKEIMIDYTKLKFASTKEEVRFYTTMKELREAEKRIQIRFHDMCSIEDMEILKIFMHLDRYYLDALELLGFRPKEVDYILDSSDARDAYNTLDLVDQEIDDAYDGAYMGPVEPFFRYMNAPGLSVLSHVSDKILYSMENFVTALRDDL